MVKARVSDERRTVSYVLLAISLSILLLLIVPVLRYSETSSARLSAVSQNNLRQLWYICEAYAANNDGVYPPISRYGYWAPDMEVMYPDYMQDPFILISPRLPRHADDVQRMIELSHTGDWEAMTRLCAKHYTYTGWLVTSESEALLLSQERQNLPDTRPGDAIVHNGTSLPYLTQGIERLLVTDVANPAQKESVRATIPVAFENIETAQEFGWKGCNVLYLDGDISYTRFGTFPVTEHVAEAFRMNHQ